MAFSPVELREMAEHLLELARTVEHEGEPLDISDIRDFSMEEMSELRSFVSKTRKACDVVSKGLAMYWQANYLEQRYEDETNTWYVAPTKGKRLIDPPAFYAWLAQQDEDKLSLMVSAASIKVSGLTPVERETFLDEEPTSQNVALNNKPRW